MDMQESRDTEDPRRRRGGVLLVVLALLSLFVISACQGLGAEGGEARVYLENSLEGPGGPGPVGAMSAQSGFTGEVHIRVMALIEDSDGFLTNVSEDPQDLVLDLGEATDPIELGRRTLAPAEYTRVRLLFTRIEAQLTGGPPGFDMPADGIVTVQMGEGDRVAVTRAAGAVIDVDDLHEVTVDLSTGIWLNGAVDGVVPTAVFSSALSARIN